MIGGLKRKDQTFLAAVQMHDGRATTEEIHKRTGLNQDERNYRFRKLDEADLINIGYDDQRTHPNGNPSKIAILTDAGREAIAGDDPTDYDLIEDKAVEDALDELWDELDHIHRILDSINNRLEQLERFRDRLKSLFSFER